jgi:hypothetical protein
MTEIIQRNSLMKFKNIFTLLIALVLFTSCKEEERNLKALVGTWISDENYAFDVDIASSLLYKFNDDGTFSALTRVIQGGNVNDVVGYTYRAEGVFAINESNLTSSFSEVYLSDGSLPYFSEVDDLILSEYNETQYFGISFNKDNTQLTLIYSSCPPNANCIGDLSFNRLASIE